MIPTLAHQQRTSSNAGGGVPGSSKQRSAPSSSSLLHRRAPGDGIKGLGHRPTSAGDDDDAETSLVLAGAALGVGESGDAWGAQALQTMHQIVSSGALLAEREAALRQREEAIQVGEGEANHLTPPLGTLYTLNTSFSTHPSQHIPLNTSLSTHPSQHIPLNTLL